MILTPRPSKTGHGAQNQGEGLWVIADANLPQQDHIAHAVDRAFARSHIFWSKSPEQSRALATQAIEQTDIVAALGSDKTALAVANGLFSNGQALSRKIVFTVLPYGNRGSTHQRLHMPKRLEDALWIAATGMTLPLPLGHVQWETGEQKVFLSSLTLGQINNAVTIDYSYQGPTPQPRTPLQLRQLSASLQNGPLQIQILRARREILFPPPPIPITQLEIFDPIVVWMEGEAQPSAPLKLSPTAEPLNIRGGWLRPPR